MPAPAVCPASPRPAAAVDGIGNGVAHCLDQPHGQQQDLANTTRHDDSPRLLVPDGWSNRGGDLSRL